ncbi:MAG: 50S ribosomal protein L17 [Verrucomicrobiota bacterium]|nr:50S ribosomal protein L17 [Verrucomicrobiota bacterium]
MRHLKRTAKLGRTSEHRNAMLANLVCSLIQHKRVITTLAKAKAARPLAEKMVTLGKRGTIHARRLAVARLHQEAAAKLLFKEVAPAYMERNGGYTRIIRLGGLTGKQRAHSQGDAAQRAILEWVDFAPVTPAAPAEGAPAPETKAAEGQPTEGKSAETAAPEAKTESK